MIPIAACAASGDDDTSAIEQAARAGGASAIDWVLYEVQARTANACDPTVGAPWQRAACTQKIAPTVTYRAEGMFCPWRSELERIRLGTLDDLRDDTDDFRAGLTLRYIDERVGANAIWLMPVFPNNDTWSIPDACDNLGSPYAVRDYLHVTGSLSRACILAGRDETSAEPCWGDDALAQVIADAHARGLKVMLDLAFNHFGHNYSFYDLADVTPVRERIARGEDLDRLWDFAGTYEASLVWPEVLDREAEIPLADRAAIAARCPGLHGDPLVRAYDVWREALDAERATFRCDALFLEHAAPGFYVGADHFNPSRHAGDNFSGDGWNTWADVKFLYHRADNAAHRHEYVRNREYLFRVMNTWAARGVDGFRLDHTTDAFSGLAPDEWRYVIDKVAYYSALRGQPRPVYLAEEFHDQYGMAPLVDVMTEGYVGDMTARNGQTKDAGRVEWIVDNTYRFGDTFVMAALETHDERRLTDGTGFDPWTGAGFWGVGAASYAVPMLLMGQELGEARGLAFRKSDFVHARFVGSGSYRADADLLLGYYRRLIRARLAPENRALRAFNHRALRTRDGGVDPRVFAQARWSDDANVVFTFFNLWPQHVVQHYFLPPDLAAALHMGDDSSYRLVDAISGLQQGPCRLGRDLKWDFYVELDAATRAQWLRLETCR